MNINGSVGITFPDGTLQTTAAVGGGSVTGVTAVAPLTSSGGVNPAISLTGIVPPANGGTGASSLTGFLFGNGASPATPATAAQLTSLLGTTPVQKATNIDGGAANQIPFQTAAGVTSFTPAPTLANTYLEWDGTNLVWAAGDGTGTVTSASVVSANGFAGTVATPTTTPAITISTSITGVLLGNGTSISAAAASDITTLLGSTPVGLATNLAGGLAGSLPYQTGAGVTTFLAAGTPGQTLTISAGNLPVWTTAAANATLTIGTGLDGTSYNGSTAVTVKLADTAVAPATYGTAISIPVITVDQQGRLTAVTTAATIGVVYQGTWDAATNTPTLANGTGTQGSYYITNVAGTNGLGTFAIGDWIVYNGAVWDKVDNSQTTAVANFSITGIPAGRYLIGGGGSPITGQVGVPAADITGTLGAGFGGTGFATYTAGDTLYASAATTLSKLAIGAAGFIMTSTGTAPQWVNSNTLTVAKATNVAGGAAGSLPYQTAADTTAFLAAGTNGQILTLAAGVPTWTAAGPAATISGGAAGQVLYQSAAGTTAFTAVGTAGQILTSNAAGAPTWSSAFNGTVGATTPSTGAFTTLSASTSANLTTSGTVVINPTTTVGSTMDGVAIGATTPAAITGTTVTATKFVGVSGGVF